MNLILSRHGNTFRPDDKVVWVGGQNDLPLVDSGIAQAERVAAVMKNIAVAAIYFAPLKRTRQFAQIVSATAHGAALSEDKRLTELDYGKWCGMSDAEIADTFGDNCLKDWVNSSVWPAQCGWSSSEAAVRKEVEQFVEDVREKHPSDANVLVVSSNGRLRYFLSLIEGEFEKRVREHTFKVATGRVCLLTSNEQQFSLLLWNEQPEALGEFLHARV